jgi:hydroxymethylbilane synthase
MSNLVRLATRGSDLALTQTREVARLLREAHPGVQVSEVVIRTTGDRDKDADLSQSAEPGLFTKELEAALLDNRADAAVHSLKDLPTTQPDGLKIAAVLPRADSADVLVASEPGGLDALQSGARVGTGSPRRKAMLLAARPDLSAVSIRGNVPTRLGKLASGEYDAIILAAAGLSRLGYEFSGPMKLGERTLYAAPLEDFLPAPGQGAIAVEVRAGDDFATGIFAALHDEGTDAAVRAEREVLRASGGGCHMALGAKAQFAGGELHLEAVMFDDAGGSPRYASAHGGDPETLGREVAAKLHGES